MSRRTRGVIKTHPISPDEGRNREKKNKCKKRGNGVSPCEKRRKKKKKLHR